MPGWHEKTKALQDAGKLQLVGIIQEQHPDRTRLFMQWKEMGWPLLIDSLNLLDVSAVPLTYLVDEEGVVRYERPSDEDLETFLATDYANEDAAAPSLDPEVGSPEYALLWEDDGDVSDAITKLGGRIAEAPEDSRAHFRLGVAYRKRYDSGERRAGDFQKAVEHWVRALELDPNQYIFRRRIQQYGPRLDKPYPFYDWVPEARAAVEARDETPVTLRVEPGGAEFAAPLKSFAASAETGTSPDPDGRIFRDEKPLIVAETVVVPTVVEPGESARIHVAFRPDLSLKAHWNNEVDDLVFWVDPPAGWSVDRHHHTVAIPREPVSQELRQVEFEIVSPEDFEGTETIPAYALYYVCEDVDGTCLFRRQDVHVEVSAPSLEISAPAAKIVPKELEAHGDVRIDNY
ncbi:MAG: hypothetical protein E2P02_24615 [Acidobacteria bacterium]|nr:MAG: hypothetical protein E2P02_24615 [Acidobacteriota bacterium]